MKTNQNHPLYTIGVVAEMMGIHPETIRVWETSGTVPAPQRRSGKRFYSENDLNRLRFVHKLAGEGLPQRAIIYYLRLYPCWKTVDCPGCLHSVSESCGTKPCWQKEDSYCHTPDHADPCSNCALQPPATPVPENIKTGEPSAGKVVHET